MPFTFFWVNRLFWKTTIWFLILLILLGVGYLISTTIIANRYFQEINERLYGSVAAQMVKQTNPLKGGRPDTIATHDIIHSIMVINPSVEVYLLDTAGNIIDYLVSKNKVMLKSVDIGPVKKMISTNGTLFILGDNPKYPLEKSVFSAAPIYENNKLRGYAYAILASEQQAEILDQFRSSFILRVAGFIFLVALMMALIIGVVVFWIFSRNLRELTYVVNRYKEGDYSVRVEGKAGRDLSLFAETLNSMADSIAANTEKIKSIDRLRKELVANVSHDLRTPLAIMQGYIETIQLNHKSISSEERERYLYIIADSSKKLSRLVNQLFEYTKLDAKQAGPMREPFLLDELVSDLLQQFGVLAKKKGILLEMERVGEVRPVYADLSMIEQVLQNLLDNAMKHTPPNGCVRIILVNKSSTVEVTVSDNGSGISTPDGVDIFERYQQALQGGMRNEGSGLGLAIVKKILELHQSSISVVSKLGVGTSFRFELHTFVGVSSEYVNKSSSSSCLIG